MPKIEEKVIDVKDEREGLVSSSSLDSDIRCLGKRSLESKIPVSEKKSTKWSETGDKVHQVLEGKLAIEDVSNSDKYTVGRIMNEEARIFDKAKMQGSKVFREKRLWATDQNMAARYSGRLDTIYLKALSGLFIDYKSGFAWVVPIERNWQICSQAVLVYENFGCTSLVGTLIHPHHPDSLSESRFFKEDELKYLSQEILLWIDQMVEDAPRTPNAISCAYCKAKGICPEYQSLIKVIQVDSHGKLATADLLRTMSPSERATRLDELDLASKIIKHDEDLAKILLKEDEASIVNYRLSPSATTEITDDKKAKEIVAQKYGEEIAENSMIFNLTLCAEQVGTLRGNKKKGKEEVLIDLSSVIVKKPKSPSLKKVL